MKLGYAIRHEIRIRASANMGFIVKIGCGEFVAANKGDLFSIGHEFIDDPDKWEKEYNKLPGSGGAEGEEILRSEGPNTTAETDLEETSQ